MAGSLDATTERERRVHVAVVGAGNVGSDLVCKLLAEPGPMELVLVGDLDPRAAGLRLARDHGISTSDEGLAEAMDDPAIEIVFDATTAAAHRLHSVLLAAAGKVAIDLTPAAAGLGVVPPFSPAAYALEPNLSLVSCPAQATVPLVRAVSRTTPVLYAETVSTLASSSVGRATRQSIDELTTASARALEELGGAARGKSIAIVSPAEPPVTMRSSIFVVPHGDAPDETIADAVHAAAEDVRRRVPGYSLVGFPAFEERATPWGSRRCVRLLVEVRGAGDTLGPFAGNLDVTTCAARAVGTSVAKRLLAAREVAA